MSTKQFHSAADGTIPGLTVVGIHGRFDDNQTPARATPVLADSQGRHVVILEANPAGGQRYRLSVEVARRKIDEDVWSTTGTRMVPPWPVRLGNIVAVLGGRERPRARELAGLPGHEGESPEVLEFLNWLSTDAAYSQELCCARVDDLFTWYCTREQARSLWLRIAAIAKRDMIEAAAHNQPALLQRASLWLSRAAGDEADMFLAVAGARRAEYRHWKALLDAGVRSGSEAERLTAVDAADRTLPSPRSPVLDLPVPPMSKFSRMAVWHSVQRLRSAGGDAQVVA
jgi:hypothetical protein